MSTDHHPNADSEPASQDEAPAERTGALDALLQAVAKAPVISPARVRARALPSALQEAMAEVPHPESSEDVPACGQVVAERYRIERRVGAGGMGVVFAATHLATGRTVALKWMTLEGRYRSQGERRRAFQRFAREAQATARIRHPNVVDVLDASADPALPFLVMEYLEGESLRSYLDRVGKLDFARACALITPVLDAVAEAHRRGVVHRDLKPDNVFLAQSANGPVPKVLDFGVSRLHGADTAEASLTRTGTVLGTPAYMPLEQLRGQGDIDARTDVYALGVMLYEMLSAKRPFEARNAPDYAALLACERPAPLSRLCPELRGPREAVVMRALARAASDRYPDVPAFRAALDASALRTGRSGRVLWAAGLLLAGAAAVAGRLAFGVPVPPGAQAVPNESLARVASHVAPAGSAREEAVPHDGGAPTAAVPAALPPVVTRGGAPQARAAMPARRAVRTPSSAAPAAASVDAGPTSLRVADFTEQGEARSLPAATVLPREAPTLLLDRAQF